MKICLVGNSHLAALKLGLKESKLASKKVLFWGAPGDWFKQVRYRNGKLVAPPDGVQIFRKISGGQYDDLPISEFDVIVLHGIYVQHNSVRQAMKMTSKSRFMSAGLMDAALRDIVLRTMAFDLAKNIRGENNVQVFISVTPLPTDKGLNKEQVAPDMIAKVEAAANKLAKELSINLLPQPAESLTDDQLASKEIYANDRHHMLGTYGTLVLNELNARLVDAQ